MTSELSCRIFFVIYFQRPLLNDLLLLLFVIFLNFVITIRGTIFIYYFEGFVLYSQFSILSYLYSFQQVYCYVFISVSKTIELVTLCPDKWVGEALCVCVCVCTHAPCFWVWEIVWEIELGCWNVWISSILQYLECTEV